MQGLNEAVAYVKGDRTKARSQTQTTWNELKGTFTSVSPEEWSEIELKVQSVGEDIDEGNMLK